MRLQLNSPFFFLSTITRVWGSGDYNLVSASYHVILVCFFHVIFPCLPSPSLSLQPEKLIYLPYYHFSCYLIINIIHFGLRFLFQMKDNQLIMSVTLLFQSTFIYYFCFVFVFFSQWQHRFDFLANVLTIVNSYGEKIFSRWLRQNLHHKNVNCGCKLWSQR